MAEFLDPFRPAFGRKVRLPQGLDAPRTHEPSREGIER